MAWNALLYVTNLGYLKNLTSWHCAALVMDIAGCCCQDGVLAAVVL